MGITKANVIKSLLFCIVAASVMVVVSVTPGWAEHSGIISGGNTHSLAIKDDGTVWAWGKNHFGQLGDGTTTDRLSPVSVNFSGVIAVCGSANYSMAVKADGTVWAWGYNQDGFLGDGTAANRLTPVQIPGLTGIIAVAGGNSHRVALRNDGTVWTWGANQYGQIGDGSTTDRSKPAQLLGLTQIKAIAAGNYHCAALRNDGTVWTWGHNLYGQIGNGSTIHQLTPMQVPDLNAVTAIAAGGSHTVALKADGTVSAWGRNQFGQLGNNTLVDVSKSVPVSGIINVIAVAAGESYTIMLRNDGAVWGTGHNSYGQIGDGTTNSWVAPVKTSLLTHVTAIAAGNAHSLAFQNNGSIWASGWNSNGQIGNGTTNNQSTPVQVMSVDVPTSPNVSLPVAIINETQMPVPNAQINVWSESAGIRASATTFLDGTCILRNLVPADDYLLTVFSLGFPLTWYNGKLDAAHADKLNLEKGAVAVNIMLKRGGVIQGAVFIGDTDHAAPPGIRVWAWSESLKTGRNGVTNERGEYEIFGLESSVSDYILSIREPNYPIVYYKDDTDADPYNNMVSRLEDATGVAPSSENRFFILPSTVSIKGSVTLNNQPIADVRVEAIAQVMVNGQPVKYGWGETFSAKEAATGFNYTLSGLRPGGSLAPVIYQVTIYPPPAYAAYTGQTQNVSVYTTDVLNINFELSQTQKQMRSISGNITGLNLGQQAKIKAFSASFSSGNSVETNRSNYIIPNLIPASDYVVEIIGPSGVRIMYDNKIGWMPPDLVDISAGDRSDIHFTLPSLSDMPSISGSVEFPIGSVSGETVWVEAMSVSTGVRRGVEVKYAGEQKAFYQISGLPKSSDYVVSVRSAKYQTIFYNGNAREADADKVDISTQSKTGIDFKLQKGKSISGKVLDSEGIGLAMKSVFAYSESAKIGGTAVSKADGSYMINGLTALSDYLVGVQDQLGLFYYSTRGTVRDASPATRLSTVSENPIHINMIISSGQRISGNVKTTDGIALSGIWVSAWSDMQKAGNGVFTDNKGVYELKGLPDGWYEVIAQPMQGSIYQSQKKSGVSSGSADVNFMLIEKTGNFKLSGKITASDTKIALSGARIDLWKASASGVLTDQVRTASDTSGLYELTKLSQGDYKLAVFPPATSGYAPYSTSLSISADLTHHIECQRGTTLTGFVKAKDGSAISDAAVHVYSKNAGFWKKTVTDKDGKWQISQSPVATDWIAVVIKDGYAQEEQAISDTHSEITLSAGGTISGMVTDEAGKPVAGVRLAVYSKTLSDSCLSCRGTAWTNAAGIYKLAGLKSDDNGTLIQDYVVSIMAFTTYSETGEAIRYEAKSKTGLRVGDSANFVLTRIIGAGTDVISGEILNLSDIDGDYAAVDLFNKATGKFDQHLVVQKGGDGKFKFVGLDTTTQYQLGCGVYVNGNSKTVRYQWYGNDKAGNSLENAPGSSTAYFSGTWNIPFTFDMSELPATRSISNQPGTVQGLHSATHPHASSNSVKNLRTVQNMARSPSDIVSNNPNITVTWDASGTDEDERYYCEFNTDAGHTITKRNAPAPAIATRQATSIGLSGDYVTYYFHIAIEDSRGRIGETSTLPFIIDTVAPQNPSVRAVSTSGTLILELGATGADDMYVSDAGYGMGSYWEKFTTTKQWHLSDSSTSMIYVQFRDEAQNTVNTAVMLSPNFTSLSNAVNILNILAGISTDASDATGDQKISIEDAVYVLQGVAGRR